MLFRKKYGGLGFYLVVTVFVLVAVVYVICTPQYSEIKTGVYSISCQDALGKVVSAVEDYETNNSKTIVKPGKMVDLDFLKENGYLDEIRLCPNTGSFIYNEKGEIVCTLHGNIKGNKNDKIQKN